jgi:hypothetical protein
VAIGREAKLHLFAILPDFIGLVLVDDFRQVVVWGNNDCPFTIFVPNDDLDAPE